MSVQLVSLGESPSVVLDKPILLFGRDQECDIRLESRKISRRHCCVAQVGEQLVVRDLGSTNGVRINGVRVVEGYLKGGDELTIGNCRYRVSWDQNASGRARDKMQELEPAQPRFQEQPQDDDDVLESCDDPIPLVEGGPPKASKQDPGRPMPPASLPPSVNKAPSVNFEPDQLPAPQPVKMTFADMLPENIELAPASDLFPPPSPPKR